VYYHISETLNGLHGIGTLNSLHETIRRDSRTLNCLLGTVERFGLDFKIFLSEIFYVYYFIHLLIFFIYKHSEISLLSDIHGFSLKKYKSAISCPI
jgi:hypothetical protein